jgi:hypothetical protein
MGHIDADRFAGTAPITGGPVEKHAFAAIPCTQPAADFVPRQRPSGQAER